MHGCRYLIQLLHFARAITIEINIPTFLNWILRSIGKMHSLKAVLRKKKIKWAHCWRWPTRWQCRQAMNLTWVMALKTYVDLPVPVGPHAITCGAATLYSLNGSCQSRNISVQEGAFESDLDSFPSKFFMSFYPGTAAAGLAYHTIPVWHGSCNRTIMIISLYIPMLTGAMAPILHFYCNTVWHGSCNRTMMIYLLYI